MALRPRILPSNLGLSASVVLIAWLAFRPFIEPVPALPTLLTSLGFSILAFISTLYLVPALGPSFVKAGLKGKDRAKVYTDDMSVLNLLSMRLG